MGQDGQASGLVNGVDDLLGARTPLACQAWIVRSADGDQVENSRGGVGADIVLDTGQNGHAAGLFRPGPAPVVRQGEEIIAMLFVAGDRLFRRLPPV